MLKEDSSHFCVCPTPAPTVIKERLVSVSAGMSVVVRSSIPDRALPNSDAYPPVLKLIPLNKNGEYLPLAGVPDTVLV